MKMRFQRTLLTVLVVLTAAGAASCASLFPVAAQNGILQECLHLNIEEEGQVNFFDGKYGQRCCMCRKGTRIVKECDLNIPNSTICEDCQYDEEKQSYIDFGPHQQTQCYEDTLVCLKHQVKIPGSPSSPSKCVCPNGTEPVDRGYRCEPVADSGMTAASVYATTAKEKDATTQTPAKHTAKGNVASAQPTIKISVDTTAPFEKVQEPKLDVTGEDKESDIDETTSASRTIFIGTPQEVTRNLNNSVAAEHSPFEHFDALMSSIAVAVFIIAVILIYRSRGRILRQISSCWESAGTCFSRRETVVFHNCNESAQTLIKGSRKKPVVSVELAHVEESKPLNSAGPLEDNQPAYPVPPMDDVVAPEAPAPDQPRNNLALPKQEKELFRKACMEMALKISDGDLCQVGRELLPEGREFDDIYYDKSMPDRSEKARMIFRRAKELDPNLTLTDLRAEVKDLGYLRDIVDAKISALREAVD